MSAEPVVPHPTPAIDAPINPRTPLYTHVPARPLRVAFVLPSVVPAWLQRLQELAAEHDWLEWTAVPVEGLATSKPDVPPDLRAFLRHERSRQPHLAGAFATASMAPSVHPPQLDSVQARVAALRPDLILLWGPKEWSDALRPHASRGCWLIDASLADADAAAEALLSPLLKGNTATAVELELAAPGAPGMSLATSWGSTCLASATQQCEHAFRKLPALLLRAMRRLQQDESSWPSPATAVLRLKAPSRPLASGLRALVRTLAVRFRIRWQHERQPFEDPWFVLIRKGKAPLNPERPDVPRFQALAASSELGTQIWADPCCVDEGGRQLVFVEECTPEARIAHIACLEVPQHGPVTRLGTVLDRPYHLSFPQVFRWEDQWYMTVESGQARCVTLYRAQDFPMTWQPIRDLVSGRQCVDPVLHHHEGHWYLFVNVAESGGSTWDELFLFVADTLSGPYLPHPANPIVADVRRARPAGRLFVHEGRLIRPAQDCAPSYGAATVFNEVLELSPTRYRERPTGRLGTQWARAIDGCHTYSASDSLEVLDARGLAPAEPDCIAVLPHRGERAALQSQDQTVSVVMPAFNASPTILASMRSVLEQTHSQLELIVIDDCSSDGTWRLIQQCALTDPRVVALHLEENQGVSAARNAGIQAATGRYIAFLDSDDRWHPRKLEIQLAGMRQSGALASYAAYERVGEDGRPLSTVKPPRTVGYEDMLKSNCIGNLTGMYDRSLGDPRFQQIGHEDYVFWLRIVRLAGKAVCAGWPEPLAYYLARQNSLSANKLKAAGWQWRIYREIEGLGRARSAGYLMHYAVRALAKRI